MKEFRLLNALGEAPDEFIEEAYIEKRAVKFPFMQLTAAAGIALAIAVLLAVFASGRTVIPVTPPDSTAKTDASADITEPAVSTADNATPPVTSEKEPPVSEGFAFSNVKFFGSSPMTGVLPDYEWPDEFFGIYSDKLNFVRYIVTKRYSPGEAEKEAAEQGFLFETKAQTLYKAKIEYDYLNGEQTDIDIYIINAGTGNEQIEFEPPYCEGDRYAAMFMELNFTDANTPLGGLYFACIGDSLYMLGQNDILTEYGESIPGEEPDESERYRYTSTDNNPERYSRKFDENELAGFIREYLLKKGYEIKRLDDAAFYTTKYRYDEDGDAVVDDVLPVSSGEREEGGAVSSDGEKPGNNYEPIKTLMIPPYTKEGIYDGEFTAEDLFWSFMPVAEGYFEPYEAEINGEKILFAPPTEPTPKTWAELMGDPERNAKISSLYRITVSRVIEKPDGDPNCTYYEGVIEYDYLNGEKMNEAIIFEMCGTVKRQCKLQPPYTSGDEIALLLLEKDGAGVSRPLSSHAFVYDVFRYKGEDYFAERGQSIPEVETGIESFPISMSYLTTSHDNSVRYYGLFKAEDISAGIRRLMNGQT